MADQITGLLSPFLRSRRLAAARPYLGRGRVLDVGCGVGELARFVDAERYLGVDADRESIDIARRRFPRHRFELVGDLAAWDRDPAGFDHIVVLAVIEHVEQPSAWLTTLRRQLAPGGRFLLTTPHPSFRRLHEAGAAVGLFSRQGAAEHKELIDRRRMRRLASGAGLQVVAFRRLLGGANQLFVLEPRQAARDPA